MNLALNADIANREEFRIKALQDFSPDSIQHLERDELVAVQSKLGYGDQYGYWVTPREWIPAGSRVESRLKIDFRARLNAFEVPSDHIEEAILYCTRYSILIAMTPCCLGSRRRNKLLKPATLILIIYTIIPFLIYASSPNINNKGHYFKSLRIEDCKEKKNSSKFILRHANHELLRMKKLSDLGAWSDRPGIETVQFQDYLPPAAAGPDIRPTEEEAKTKYKPLPDEWLSEAGWRVLWLVNDLGPNIIALGQKIIELTHQFPHLNSGMSIQSIIQKRRRRAHKIIAAHRWIDRHGNDIVSPPFQLTIVARGSTPPLKAGEWPPTHVPHILKLLRFLQDAHIFIALLAVGSRISEMLSLEPGSLSCSQSGTPFINGLTFKLTQLFEGEERDWPLPNVVIEAIRQQEILREILLGLGHWSKDTVDSHPNQAESLWVRYGTNVEMVISEVNLNLRTLVSSLGMAQSPDDQNLSTHRFRKTIARLVALAISGAPKILMDLFGHKSIEMTLYYILTDPDIAAEVKLICEEIILMRASTAIENIDAYGGNAAKSIRTMKEKEKFRLGKDLGAKDIRDLAEILTMNGQSWELTRPGVICTKLPGSYGECTKSAGHPDPSHCGTSCDYRLEESFLRKDVDGCLADSIRLYETERDSGNDLMQDFWAGQVLSNISRFDDLYQKWSSHPSVQEILTSRG